MTIIRAYRDNGRIFRVDANGHAGYVSNGPDVVCAAVSTLVQGSLLGLIEIAKVSVSQIYKDGQLTFTILDSNISTRHSADIILETMCVALRDIEKDYPAHVKLEEIY
ncbi:MAG: ribosomal-processing cysteine protease Prp [Christensenellaceae bacterium]|jgi:uncharacterized protein YsxB (DUF464 family)|nr:ribosomal-processing cysteine protease Prp [Christensenellaceae bacterium]